MRLACLVNPDLGGMKIYVPVGEETFDDAEKAEDEQSVGDPRKAARSGRDAERREGSGGGAGSSGDQRGDAGPAAVRNLPDSPPVALRDARPQAAATLPLKCRESPHP